MKKLILSFLLQVISATLFAQIDTDQLALAVSNADAANTEKLKVFIWKRHSTATVGGEVKATAINELSFDEKGQIQVTQVEAKATESQKRGLRGQIQANTMADNTDYVEKALKLSLDYAYMSKGQLIDFFDKAKITDVGNYYQIVGSNVLVHGDQLTVVVEKSTNLFLSKRFSSSLDDKNPLTGEIKYDKFNSGICHITETILNLPAKNAVINAKNQDYSKRIE